MQKNQLSTINVLIVDDEKSITRIVHDVLIRLGFRAITVANSGRKAIELAMENKFDFIITDWRMGDLDGIDLVKFLRSASETTHLLTTPIIMLTGNTEAHYVRTALNAGINGYLIKPFSVEQLTRRIRNLIEHPRPFVLARSYRGPDRRYTDKGPPENIERRKLKRK